VDLLFQPIVRLDDRSIVGYEALGRGLYPELPKVPGELFRVAARLGAEAELSRLFRDKLADRLGERLISGTFFLNTHPAELDQQELVRSLEELRSRLPATKLTLEVHERAIAELSLIAELKARLTALKVGIAYDDFGAGQSRLLELAELPPDFLKFDVRFISGIDRAPASRRRLLESLVSAARDLGVRTIAEGVETAAEVEVCTGLGFDLAQGFFFRKPEPVENL
jgi:EAL domain-containing protein (putative c-di-GMP-specific phosphodiesterase class I)